MSARKLHITFVCTGPAMYSFLPVMDMLRQSLDLDVSLSMIGSREGTYALRSEISLYDMTEIPVISSVSELLRSGMSTDILVFHAPGVFPEPDGAPQSLKAQGTTLCYFPYATEFLGESYAGWIVNQPHTEFSDILFVTAPLSQLVYERYHRAVMPKMRCFGNPENDILFHRTYERHEAYPALAAFTHGHPTFLWTPHWLIDEAPYWSSWLTFGAVLKLYFARHPEYRLIIRPHPTLVEQFASESPVHRKARAIMEKLRALPNVLLDEYSTSLMSIGVADVLISDCSSIIQKFYATGKPIIVHDTNYGFLNPVMDASTYLVKDPHHLIQCMEALLAGHDPKKEQRLSFMEDFCGPTDGRCASRVASFLLHAWEQSDETSRI